MRKAMQHDKTKLFIKISNTKFTSIGEVLRHAYYLTINNRKSLREACNCVSEEICFITGDAEVIGQNKNVNNLFINKKTNYYYIFFK